MAHLIIAPAAQQDLSDIFDYIARDKPITAANWVETIEQKCRLIATAPEFGEKRPEYGSEIRSSAVGRYVVPAGGNVDLSSCYPDNSLRVGVDIDGSELANFQN